MCLFYSVTITLQIFKQFDMKTFRKKSRLLTGYWELLLKNLSPEQQQEDDQEPQAKGNKTDIVCILYYYYQTLQYIFEYNGINTM